MNDPEICDICKELKPTLIRCGTHHWCSAECCEKDPPVLWDLPGAKIISQEVTPGVGKAMASMSKITLDTSAVSPEVLAAHDKRFKGCWIKTNFDQQDNLSN